MEDEEFKIEEDDDQTGDQFYDDYINSDEYQESHLERMKHIESVFNNAVEEGAKKLKDVPKDQFDDALDSIIYESIEKADGMLTYDELKISILEKVKAEHE